MGMELRQSLERVHREPPVITFRDLYAEILRRSRELQDEIRYYEKRLKVRFRNLSIQNECLEKAIPELQRKADKKKKYEAYYEARYKIYFLKNSEKFPHRSDLEVAAVYAQIDFEKRGLVCKFKNIQNKIKKILVKVDTSWFDEKKPEELAAPEFEQILFQVFEEKHVEFRMHVFETLIKEKPRAEDLSVPTYGMRSLSDLKTFQENIKKAEEIRAYDEADVEAAEKLKAEDLRKIAADEAELHKFQEELRNLEILKKEFEDRFHIQAVAIAPIAPVVAASPEPPAVEPQAIAPQAEVAPPAASPQAAESNTGVLSQEGQLVGSSFWAGNSSPRRDPADKPPVLENQSGALAQNQL